MTSITRGQKIYFAAVGLLAVWVGMWGYFIPDHVNEAIPWLVPPLHARFLGAMYFSGAAIIAGCLLARRWAEVRIVLPMIAIWTGMLFVVSLFYLTEFDFTKIQGWLWFGLYLVYPIIAIWLAWQQRATDLTPTGSAVPKWASVYLLVQGILITLLALALLILPGDMATVWPWKITSMLAQLYSAPFLAYGVGSLLLARRAIGLEIRIGAIGILTFAVGVLLASIIHIQLFSFAELPDVLWFVGFGLMIVMLSLIVIRISGHQELQHGQ
jgi:hypothetical protein